jgi:hypothetical protein
MGNITSLDEFKEVCPILLYNFELGHCVYEDDETKNLNDLQSKLNLLIYVLILYFEIISMSIIRMANWHVT